MAEERDHILRDTEEDTATGRQRGRLPRKEEERAEAEERPVYPLTGPKTKFRAVPIKKERRHKKGEAKPSQPKGESKEKSA